MKIAFHYEHPLNPSIKKIIRKYEKYMPDWVKEITIKLQCDQNHSAGVAFTSKRYRYIIIHLDANQLDSDEIERVIVHEMCHAHTAGIMRVVDNHVPRFIPDEANGKLFLDCIDEEMEGHTEDMAQIFIALEKRNETN